MGTIKLSDIPLPQTEYLEAQAIADIVFLPETLLEAEKILTEDHFSDNKCRDAWVALKKLALEGKTIDLSTAYANIDRDLMTKGILPRMESVGSPLSAVQHFAALRDAYIRRKCYFCAINLLQSSADMSVTTPDIIGKITSLAEKMQEEIDPESSTKHISQVINEVAENIEETQRNRAKGKTARVPTGFDCLDFLTYGGYHSGNLVILAARPSVGKTAIMLQMAKAAACAGKVVNLFNLEMTNAELVQRFLYSTGEITPLQVAKGDVAWDKFEVASGQFASQPIYLNDSASTLEEIISHISLNAQAGKCDIAFIDYLGLINFSSHGRSPLHQAIADCTKKLKQTAKSCKVPIVLLCQLNRASASEKRPPALYDLRDSGSIEQDADIVLMLEKDLSMSLEEDSCRDINMWVRKNRQGKAGEVKIALEANESYTSFSEKNAPTKETPSVPEPIDKISMPIDSNPEFNDFPFEIDEAHSNWQKQ